MTRQESIKYIHLRAEECGYPTPILELVGKKLETLEEKDFNYLKRISEPAFRDWCKKLQTEVPNE